MTKPFETIYKCQDGTLLGKLFHEIAAEYKKDCLKISLCGNRTCNIK